MDEPRDTPPPTGAANPGAARKAEAARRRAEALRENLKRRKAQARGRKAGVAASAQDGDAGESAAPPQES